MIELALVLGGILFLGTVIGLAWYYFTHPRRGKRRSPSALFSASPPPVGQESKRPRKSFRKKKRETLEPSQFETGPIHYAGTAVNEAHQRASRHMALAVKARNRQDHEAAEAHLDDAFAEISYMKHDHWYLVDLLNMKGCLLYDKGFYVQAREMWEHAEQVASEWPDKVNATLPTVEKNLAKVRGMLGF